MGNSHTKVFRLTADNQDKAIRLKDINHDLPY